MRREASFNAQLYNLRSAVPDVAHFAMPDAGRDRPHRSIPDSKQSSEPDPMPKNTPNANPDNPAPEGALSSLVSGRLALAAIVVFALIAATILFFGLSPYFAISEIEVTGNSLYSDSQIISMSGLSLGQNGFSSLKGGGILKRFSFRCAGAEEAVASACPYVRTVQIRYAMPAEIKIEITERSKSVILPYSGAGLLLDGEGVAVDIMKDYSRSGLPVAAGITVNNYEIGKPVDVDVGDDMRIEMALLVANALRQVDRDSAEALAWRITSIDVGDLRNITLNMNNGINVNLGDGTELYYRVSAVKEILEHGIGEGEEGVIIFSNNARPVFVPNAAAPTR